METVQGVNVDELSKIIASRINKATLKHTILIPHFEDIEQHCWEGVMLAADRYEDQGFKFTTYAVFWIDRYILKYMEREMKWATRFQNEKVRPTITKMEHYEDDTALDVIAIMREIENSELIVKKELGHELTNVEKRKVGRARSQLQSKLAEEDKL